MKKESPSLLFPMLASIIISLIFMGDNISDGRSIESAFVQLFATTIIVFIILKVVSGLMKD